MGIIQAASESERVGPKLPEEMRHIYDEFRRVKFSIVSKDESLMLYPRPQLTFTELESYLKISRSQLKPWEIKLLMDIDAIFEGRENV